MKFKIFIILLFILCISFTATLFLNTKTPNNLDLNFIRGANAFSDNKYKIAIDFFKADLVKNPNRAESQYKIAQSYILQENQDINKAIEYYKIYINKNDLNKIVDSKLINNIQFLGMTDELNRISDLINNEVLKSEIRLKENPELAITHLKRVRKENKNQKFYEISAQAKFALHEFEEALQDIENAEHLGSIGLTLLYTKSQAQRMLQQFEKAKRTMKTYEKLHAISKSKNSKNTVNLILEFKQLNGELDQDLKTLKINNRLQSNQFKSAKNDISLLEISELTTINRIKLLTVSITEKFEYLINMIFNQLEPEKTTEVESILFCKYFSQIKNPIDAINYCANMNAKYPNLAPIYFWYGIALLKNNNVNESISKIKTAIKYAPWVNNWRIQLAEIYLTQGNLELAKEIVNYGIIINDRQLSMFRNKYDLNK